MAGDHPYFDMYPCETVKDRHGDEWTVWALRAGVSTKPPPALGWNWAVTKKIAERVPYWLKLRKDWRVLVYPGKFVPDYSKPPAPSLNETFPDKAAAMARARALLSDIEFGKCR